MITTQQQQELLDHKECIWHLSWNHVGSLLMSSSADKTAKIWKQNNGEFECVQTLSDHIRAIRSSCWSPCGRFICTASFDATVSIYSNKMEGDGYELFTTLEGHESEVKAVAWSPSGDYIATCSRDKTCWIWAADEYEIECEAIIGTHIQDVKRVIWHPHSDILVSCGYDDTIRFHEEKLSDWETTCNLAGHTSTIWAIDFNKEGDKLVSSSADLTLRIWGISPLEKNDWICLCTISGYHNRDIFDVSWCKLTGLIATACGDNMVRLFRECEPSGVENELSFAMVEQVSNAHSRDVNTVCWNPKIEGQLASAGDDCVIRIWKVDASSLS